MNEILAPKNFNDSVGVSNQDKLVLTPRILSEIYYDESTKRYRWRDTKKFVARDVVNQLVDRRLSEEKTKLTGYASRIQRGEIGVYSDVAKTLKNVHLLEAIKAKKGFENITNSDLGVIGNNLKKQYYLGKDEQTGKNFGIKYLIEEAPTISVKQLENRLRMYGESAKLTGYTLSQSDALMSGKTAVRRILGLTDFHCPECLSYAAMGYQPIGTLPLPKTKCTCRANCLCSLEFA